MELTKRQIMLIGLVYGACVQNTIEKGVSVGKQFYRTLLLKNSGLLETHFGTVDTGALSEKFDKAFSALITGVNNVPELVPVLRELGKKHKGMNLEQAHWDAVGNALIETLQFFGGENFNEEVKEAYLILYNDIVVRYMKEGIEQA